MSKTFSSGSGMTTIQWITHSAIIAALYVILTFVTGLIGFSSGPIQLRLSEALTILPIFTPAAVPGLFLGCLIANILSGCALWDIIFGSLATLAGALGTYLLRSKKWLRFLPPILANTLVLPFIFRYVYGTEGTLIYFAVTILISESLSCGIFGSVLYRLLDRHRNRLPWK